MTPLLSSEWILDVAARSMAIMLAGIAVYMLQKELEKKRNQRDMARILCNEVTRLLGLTSRRRVTRLKTSRKGIIHDSRVYNGLLHTGNIRFFSNDLQDDLHHWYSSIDDFEFDDLYDNLGKNLVKNLESMEEKNAGGRQACEMLATWLRRKFS